MTPVDTLWLTNPTLAYADWQRREAAGAERELGVACGLAWVRVGVEAQPVGEHRADP